MSKRTYSDRDRASALAALDANAGNVNRTAKQTGVPRATLQEWIAGRVSADVPEIRQEKKKSLADSLETLAHQLVNAMPDKIEDASLQQVATSAAIAIDKMRLLRGEPTVITDENVKLREAAERLAAQYDKPFDEVLADLNNRRLASQKVQ